MMSIDRPFNVSKRRWRNAGLALAAALWLSARDARRAAQ
jgi:hypothetical protein